MVGLISSQSRRRKDLPSVCICVSNFGVQVVQLFDGILHDRRGVDAMLVGEALLGIAGVVVFAVVFAVTRRTKARPSGTALGSAGLPN